MLERFWQEQGLLWCGFAFAAGVALFIALPAEPSRLGLLFFAGGVILTAILSALRGHLGWRAALLLACAGGVTIGALRSEQVRAPRLAEAMNVTLTGKVLDRRAGLGQARIVLAVETVDGWRVTAGAFPEKVRMRVPLEGAGQVGDHVRLRGRLFPPPGPVHPGGYDFSFRAYFDGIGATGFSFGEAERLEGGAGSPGLMAAAMVARVRSDLAHQIRTVLQERPEAALVVALLVGDRSGISEQQEEVLRAAGLAHILAISGLHMALFAGGTYGGVVLLLALVPSVPLRWPTHKWAALAALAAAIIYLGLSGAAVATQRSFLMIALVFLGILAGRRGLTLRSVALAGLLLLILGPERLFYPGFQMSFAAVICLVAVYDFWRKRERALEAWPEPSGPLRKSLGFVGKWAAGLLVTALVAGLATGIIGAHHFGRIAPYGVIGNMLGMPVFSLLVMPMGVLALLLMPFGLAALPLSLMAFGISLLLRVAEFTAGLDGGAGTLGKLDGTAALLFMMALFAGLLLPGRLRIVVLAPLAAGLFTAASSRPPDIQIAASGSRLAARDLHGELRYAGRTNSFVNDLWFQVEGVPANAIKSRKMVSAQRACDPDGCVIRAYGPAGASASGGEAETVMLIAAPKGLEALELDCRNADIIVSDQIVPDNCGARIVLDRRTRLRRGAVSIWLEQERGGPDPPGSGWPGSGRHGEARAGANGPGGSGQGQSSPGSGRPGTRRTDVGRTDTDRTDAGGTDAGGASSLRTGSAAGPGIVRMIYAIPDPPRRWNAVGTVTRRSLKRAMRADGGTGSP